jgi:hypothetical protein
MLNFTAEVLQKPYITKKPKKKIKHKKNEKKLTTNKNHG